MLRIASFFIILLVSAAVIFASAPTTPSIPSDYYERLDLTPLPNGLLLASFDFRANESLLSYEQQNFRYFPRSLGQVLQHANTKELHLRFTTGRWDAEEWGARPWGGAKEGGTGVELWAWIDAATEEEAMTNWITLNQGLSGLFCASLNFIDQTRTTQPVLSFEPMGHYSAVAKRNLHLLHGVLPGEVVCTENLTPFLKLLPCKGKAGISSLLDGHKVFDASWQSMSIDVRPKCNRKTTRVEGQLQGGVNRGKVKGEENEVCDMEINQTIDMVLDIARSRRPREDPIPRPVPAERLVCDESKPYHNRDTCYPLVLDSDPAWSLKEVFGRPMAGNCPLTDKEGPNGKSICIHVPHERMIMIGASGFEVKSSVSTSSPQHRCYQLMPAELFDMDLSPYPRFSSPSSSSYLSSELVAAERTMTGHGSASGGMRTVFTNPSATEPVRFVYFESLPWFLRAYMHTLKAEIVESEFPFPWGELVEEMYYRPAIDRKRGTQLEIVMSLPPATSVMLTYDFEKAILRYTEYPPDANRGFNVAPAVIRILDKNTTSLSSVPSSLSPSELTSQHSSEPTSRGAVYIRTTSLLAALPTPDFSMPYNVIILTSTVMALAFGSIFNLLVRRFVAADEVPESQIKAAVLRLKAKATAVVDTFLQTGVNQEKKEKEEEKENAE